MIWLLSPYSGLIPKAPVRPLIGSTLVGHVEISRHLELVTKNLGFSDCGKLALELKKVELTLVAQPWITQVTSRMKAGRELWPIIRIREEEGEDLFGNRKKET